MLGIFEGGRHDACRAAALANEHTDEVCGDAARSR
jgi:hypothetical protein